MSNSDSAAKKTSKMIILINCIFQKKFSVTQNHLFPTRKLDRISFYSRKRVGIKGGTYRDWVFRYLLEKIIALDS